MNAERRGNSTRYGFLQLEEVCNITVKLISPDSDGGVRIDQMRVGLHLGADFPDAAFQEVSNIAILSDLSRVDDFSFVSESRRTRNNHSIGQARKISGQIIGDRVGEIAFLQIVAHAAERQNHDGSLSGMRALAMPDRQCGHNRRDGHAAANVESGSDEVLKRA